MALTIQYWDKSHESFRNVKDESSALNIVKRRNNVMFAMYNGRIIHGEKPKPIKRNNELTLEEMEELIKRI